MFLEMKNITKCFDATKALDDVSFSCEKGEIRGLLGENGAGKSTLMNILGGVFPPTEGRVLIEGKDITESDEKKASGAGIRFVHQELNIINDLRVYENLFLGEEISRGFGFTDKKHMREKSIQVLTKVNLGDLDPDLYARELDTSHKQLLEIARALLFDAKVIILDEPTTALSEEEIKNLFGIMRNLKSEGVTMIYISHKMAELFEICDTFTVLRDGKFIASGKMADIDEKQATAMLTGRTVKKIEDKVNHSKEVIFRAENISCGKYFRNVSFDLREGEVLVFTGLQGDGRGELAEALFGIRKLTEGKTFLDGKEMKYPSIKAVMKSGIGMIPRNRKERGIIKDLSILDNLSVAGYAKEKGGFFVDRKKQLESFEECKTKLNLKAGNPKDAITSLSGGNQQKAVIQRWISLKSRIYIFDNPTQGVDVGAKFEIYKLINQLAEEGISIIVFTSEYPEIQQVGDRLIIMYDGEVNGMMKREEFDENQIMYYATGGGRRKRE